MCQEFMSAANLDLPTENVLPFHMPQHATAERGNAPDVWDPETAGKASVAPPKESYRQNKCRPPWE